MNLKEKYTMNHIHEINIISSAILYDLDNLNPLNK